MEKDYTVFNIPHADQMEPAEIFVEEKPVVIPDSEPRDIFEDIYEPEVEVVSDYYTELNQIAEELEECRLRNC